MNRTTPGRVFSVIATAMLLSMVLVPLIYPHGSFIGLDGGAGTIDSWSKTSFADPFSRMLYGLGDIFCHQEESRSFIINGSQMAFCQRDVSILAGFAVALPLIDILSEKIEVNSKPFFASGVLLTSITLVEWAIEFSFGVDVPVARVITGILSGAGIAILLQYAVFRQYEKIVFGEKV